MNTPAEGLLEIVRLALARYGNAAPAHPREGLQEVKS
jgi:hypothetical protein